MFAANIGWGEIRWIARITLAVGVAAALAYVPYRVLDRDGARRLSKMELEIAKLTERREKFRGENRELRLLNRGLRQDPNMILDMARTELGLVFPSEIVVRVTEQNE